MHWAEGRETFHHPPTRQTNTVQIRCGTIFWDIKTWQYVSCSWDISTKYQLACTLGTPAVWSRSTTALHPTAQGAFRLALIPGPGKFDKVYCNVERLLWTTTVNGPSNNLKWWERCFQAAGGYGCTCEIAVLYFEQAAVGHNFTTNTSDSKTKHTVILPPAADFSWVVCL